jgi:hypothetical protein
MRRTLLLSSVALIALAMLSGCNEEQASTDGTSNGNTSSSRSSDLTLPSGTSIQVALGTPLSSETANVGSSWNGSTTSSSVVDGRNVIPAGSSVSGTVTAVDPAQKGDRAMLDLGLTSISVGSRTYRVHGGMESVIAGSTRARNLGAIAGSAAGGALIGKAVSGTGKGALIGGVIGGGVATGVVAASDGYQVVLKAGTPLTFTTTAAVAVRP